MCINMKRHCQTLEAFGVSQLESHSCLSYILFWIRSLLNAILKQRSDWIHKPLNSTLKKTVPILFSLYPSHIIPFFLLRFLLHVTGLSWYNVLGLIATFIYCHRKWTKNIGCFNTVENTGLNLKIKLGKNHDALSTYHLHIYTFTKI